jgi:hypothetical protein
MPDDEAVATLDREQVLPPTFPHGMPVMEEIEEKAVDNIAPPVRNCTQRSVVNGLFFHLSVMTMVPTLACRRKPTAALPHATITMADIYIQADSRWLCLHPPAVLDKPPPSVLPRAACHDRAYHGHGH